MLCPFIPWWVGQTVSTELENHRTWWVAPSSLNSSFVAQYSIIVSLPSVKDGAERWGHSDSGHFPPVDRGGGEREGAGPPCPRAPPSPLLIECGRKLAKGALDFQPGTGSPLFLPCCARGCDSLGVKDTAGPLVCSLKASPLEKSQY